MSQPALYFKWYKIAHGPRANLAWNQYSIKLWINAQMLNLPCYLGHIIILCVLISRPVPARVTIKWNYKDFNLLDNLRNVAADPWDLVYLEDDLDSAVDCFTKLITDDFEHYATIKKIHFKAYHPP